ncbi:MAG: AI-2E family transporter [Syntrophomonadaceae bacterium]|nr:AI-2E family transporter [Syntrophomonadaceae bacterium]
MHNNNKKVWRYIIFFIVSVSIAWFLYLVREVLLTFLLGAILAYLLFRPVRWIEKHGVKRAWAILLLYLFFAALLGSALVLAIPAIIREMTILAHLYPQYADQVQELTARIDHINMPAKLSEVLNQNLARVEKGIYNAISNFLGGLYALFGKMLALIFSPILAFYMMNDWEKIRDVFLNLWTPKARREAVAMFAEIDSVLIEFIKGHLMIAALVGCAVGLAALLLGVRFPLLLGIVTGLCDLVPYFGAFLGAIPAVAVGLSQSLNLGIYMAVSIVIIQQLESNIVTPRIMGGKLGLHPLTIVFALLAGGKLMGIWGLLFAVPLLASLKVVLARAYLWLVDKG